VRKASIALSLALGATLALSAHLGAHGVPGHAGGVSAGHFGPHLGGLSSGHFGPTGHFGPSGHFGPHLGGLGAAGVAIHPAPSINPLMRGSANPVLLPAWRSGAVPGRTVAGALAPIGFPVGAGWGGRPGLSSEPGVTVVSPVGDSRSEGAATPLVNNGDSDRRSLTGAVVAVRPGGEDGAQGTIQLHLIPVELPEINGKKAERPEQDVTIHVGAATVFLVRDRKGPAGLGDVHLGQTVRIGLDGQLTREVEVLAMFGGR
jgi:hypothetical protein